LIFRTGALWRLFHGLGEHAKASDKLFKDMTRGESELADAHGFEEPSVAELGRDKRVVKVAWDLLLVGFDATDKVGLGLVQHVDQLDERLLELRRDGDLMQGLFQVFDGHLFAGGLLFVFHAE